MEPREERLVAAGYQPLVVLTTIVAAGMVLDRWGALPGWVWPAGTLVSLVGWWPAWRMGQERTAMIWLCAAVLCWSGGWHAVAWNWFPARDLGRRLGPLPQPVCVEAEVLTEPRVWEAPARHPLASYPPRDEMECLVELRAVRERQQWRSCAGRARLVIATAKLAVHCGDRIRVYGLASRPAPPGNPGEYDGAAAERGQRRLCRLKVPDAAGVQQVRPGAHWTWTRWLAELRSGWQLRLRRFVPARQAPLAAALLLGTREQLDTELSHTFFVTGLAHLLAISGLNVAIFAYGFWAVVRLGWLPRRPALLLVAGLAVFYALLTGADPPVTRAAILVVCICGARWLGRQGLALNSLAAAALLVMVHQPAALFQTGAQLSFLAVAVLCRAAAAAPAPRADDPLERLKQRARPVWERGGRRLLASGNNALLTSAQVWLVSLPLVVWRFHLVSPVALLLNPLVLLPAAVALYAGFLTLLLGSVWPAAASVAGWVCGGVLTLIDQLLRWGRDWPASHYWTPGPTGEYVVGFYLAAAVLPLIGVTRRWCWTCAVAGVALMLIPGEWFPRKSFRSPAKGETAWSCTLVSVGHGTSALVEWPDGRRLLYDCGQLGWPPTGARAISGVLWSRGVSRLDAVVISHADTDHFNALPDLLERFTVGTVYVSPQMFERPSGAVRALRSSLRAHGVVCRTLHAGDRLWEVGDACIEVLHPPRDFVARSDNESSLVLLCTASGRRLLLPGDLEEEGMRCLLAQEPQMVDVAMAPHHGSTSRESGEFLTWASPGWIVVSGSASRLRAAGPQTAAAATVWHTAREGALHLEFSRETVTLQAWCGRWKALATLPVRPASEAPRAGTLREAGPQRTFPGRTLVPR
ncbi:MAG: ComEC/Rec2 family competence protein [Pirellulales bacterium]